MVRLPLLINRQRIKTLEELHENFNLVELIERYQGGQLRAWLNCWDFNSELEQLKALSADLSDQRLAEALCRIFGIEGGSKEQALNSLKEEKARQVQEQQLEAQRQQEQQRQEEQRKAEESRPLALDEIEFDWQMTEGPDVKLLTAGADRFVTVTNDSRAYYSYDGRHWEGGPVRFKITESDILYCCNGNLMCSSLNGTADYNIQDLQTYHISPNCQDVRTIGIDKGIGVQKIIWTGDRYIALSFSKGIKTSAHNKPVIYAAEKLTGPWYAEYLECLEEGDVFTDIAFFNNKFIIEGKKLSSYAISYMADVQFFCMGPSISKLHRIMRRESSSEFTRLWQSKHLCFSDNRQTPSRMINDDESPWSGKLKYRITELVDADRFIVAHLFEAGKYSFDTKDIGFHVSLDGINWRKLNSPLQQGKMAYLNGKLLIADGSKIAIGTLKN